MGSAYITDIGMTGPENSILGTKVEAIIDRFIMQTPQHFIVADGGVKANGVIFDIDPDNKKVKSVTRVKF